MSQHFLNKYLRIRGSRDSLRHGSCPHRHGSCPHEPHKTHLGVPPGPSFLRAVGRAIRSKPVAAATGLSAAIPHAGSMLRVGILLLLMTCSVLRLQAQGLHFSQYYNAPMLLSPANTGLLQETDFRVGVNYRTQWSSVPVPFNTFSAYGDAILLPAESGTSWLGLGGAVFTDRAGNGNLALNRYEVLAAYHVFLGDGAMLSAGISGAYVQRSVDYSKLTFDMQWNGYYFDPIAASGELPGIKKTNYWDANAGLSLAVFPNDDFYLKITAGAQHLNQPTESFYNQDNQIGIRPMGHADLVYRVGEKFIVNPSVYYAYQKSASELLAGTLLLYHLGGRGEQSVRLVLGGHYRLGDAIIAAVGLEYGHLRVMSTYDVTSSSLGKYNGGRGAFELGLRWEGAFPHNNYSPAQRKVYGCPRF